MTSDNARGNDSFDELPAFLHSWKRIYLFVCFYLFILIVILIAVSRAFNLAGTA